MLSKFEGETRMSRCFFLDMNSFFASVEQQDNKELRGRPVMVVPVAVESTSAIAASYEAKALGISTGTSVRTARRIYPAIEIVAARPHRYMEYHRNIVEALNGHFVDIKPLSVDEMACGIDCLHRTRESEHRLAGEVKKHIHDDVGEWMRCSVGIAPNVFLAKVASDRQKPNGLTIFDTDTLEESLCALNLLDLPGIGAQMAGRLAQHNIRTVRELWNASPADLRRAWGSVVGARWYYMLRGNREVDYGMEQSAVRKSVGHSHVLPPEFRTERGVQDILLKLLSKCLKRLRGYGQAAGSVQISFKYRHTRTYADYGWSNGSRKHLPANDELTWLPIIRGLLASIPPLRAEYTPSYAGIVFGDLIASQDMNLSLFEDTVGRGRLFEAVDGLNTKRENAVSMANVHSLRKEAPFRIPFGVPQ